jgi:hypothetical protein
MDALGFAAQGTGKVPFEGCGTAREQPAGDGRVSAVHGRMTAQLLEKTANKAPHSGRFRQYITAM